MKSSIARFGDRQKFLLLPKLGQTSFSGPRIPQGQFYSCLFLNAIILKSVLINNFMIRLGRENAPAPAQLSV